MELINRINEYFSRQENESFVPYEKALLEKKYINQHNNNKLISSVQPSFPRTKKKNDFIRKSITNKTFQPIKKKENGKENNDLIPEIDDNESIEAGDNEASDDENNNDVAIDDNDDIDDNEQDDLNKCNYNDNKNNENSNTNNKNLTLSYNVSSIHHNKINESYNNDETCSIQYNRKRVKKSKIKNKRKSKEERILLLRKRQEEMKEKEKKINDAILITQERVKKILLNKKIKEKIDNEVKINQLNKIKKQFELIENIRREQKIIMKEKNSNLVINTLDNNLVENNLSDDNNYNKKIYKISPRIDPKKKFLSILNNKKKLSFMERLEIERRKKICQEYKIMESALSEVEEKKKIINEIQLKTDEIIKAGQIIDSKEKLNIEKEKILANLINIKKELEENMDKNKHEYHERKKICIKAREDMRNRLEEKHQQIKKEYAVTDEDIIEWENEEENRRIKAFSAREKARLRTHSVSLSQNNKKKDSSSSLNLNNLDIFDDGENSSIQKCIDDLYPEIAELNEEFFFIESIDNNDENNDLLLEDVEISPLQDELTFFDYSSSSCSDFDDSLNHLDSSDKNNILNSYEYITPDNLYL